jgi:site-specific DNA-methyltransferase (adenine-specific)
MTWKIYHGDCTELLTHWQPASIGACVTDPPYGIGFMGAKWDHPDNVAFRPETWRLVLEALKPGAYLAAFGGTRKFHRLMCAIEDAGFELRDTLCWLYGCLSDDTEILVNGKWQPYHKASAGNLALCYNMHDGSYSWQPIRRLYVYPYSDTAYRVRSDRTDQIVTRQHRCIVERGGAFAFWEAQEAARQQQARVPILEDVRGLLEVLSVPHQRAGDAEQDVLLGLRPAAARQAQALATGAQRNMRGLRQELSPAAISPCTDGGQLLLEAMQRPGAWQGLGEACAQGTSGMVGGRREELPSQDERPEQSRVARWDAAIPRRQVRAMPGNVQGDGSQGWLCRRAPACGGPCARQDADLAGGGAPSQSRPGGQSAVQPIAFPEPQRAQALRGARFTRTTVARLEPFHYSGIVWCVEVPTGAFVARRNGKVFVTGNSGMPKSHDVSKALDRAAGAEREVVGQRRGQGNIPNNRGQWGFSPNEPVDITAPATPEAQQWSGYGTALKPGWEPIVLARKPLDGTVAGNVLRHGVGALNIDKCRLGEGTGGPSPEYKPNHKNRAYGKGLGGGAWDNSKGRWPPNVCCDEAAAAMVDRQSGERPSGSRKASAYAIDGYNYTYDAAPMPAIEGSTGGASRFFYCPKASPAERNMGLGNEENTHPTVKPIALMRWLVRLVTPPGETALDPFTGSGSTGLACRLEDRPFVGMEREREAVRLAKLRLHHVDPDDYEVADVEPPRARQQGLFGSEP